VSTEDELRQAFEQLKVDDVLLQTAASLVNLGGFKLLEQKDAEQGKKAIEAVRALLPMCDEEQAGPIREALSQLQMLYVRETQGAAEPEPEPPKPDPPKIWTPPGT
jgi:hypothetical protein